MKAKKPLEVDLQRTIMEYLLTQPDFYCWRQNSGATYDITRKSFRRKGKYEGVGISDVIGMSNTGRFIAIEIKRPGSTYSAVSADQRAFIARVNGMGGAAIWVNSLEQVQEFLNDVRLGKSF